MTKALRLAIEAVLTDAQKSSVDQHGFIQHMDVSHVAVLVLEYDKFCKKHGYPRLRVSAAA